MSTSMQCHTLGLSLHQSLLQNQTQLQIQEREDANDLLELFKEALPTSILVIDKQTHKPLYHTKNLETEFKFDIPHSDEFIRCLHCFYSENKVKLQSIIDSFFPQIYSARQNFKNLFSEIMDNCQYFSQSPLLKKFSEQFEYPEDEFNEEREHKNQHEIIIETPKNQLYSKPSIIMSEETPKNQKSKIIEELLIKSQSQRTISLVQLKKRRLKISLNHCLWFRKQAFMIILQSKEIDKQLDNLQQQLNEQLQISENKDLILATVFHDFKTPINGIVSILETLDCKSEITQIEKYYHNIIKKNVYLMLYMIYDIQDYARIQKKKLRLCLTDFYINEIIDEVIEMCSIQAEQKGVEIKTYYDIPSYQIRSDPNRIKQIIMNFLSNSLKFTEQGSITITVSSLNTDKSQNIKRSNTSRNIQYQVGDQTIQQIRKSLQGRYQQSSVNKLIYSISVEDTGCGIPDNIKPQLFNLFATFSNQKIENKSGTGIGLMVCKNLVGLLGPSESIDLWSEQNVGTKMSFQIYAKLQDNNSIKSANYISCFKQEHSSQHLSIQQHDDSLNGKDTHQVIVRSSLLRIYTKPQEKTELDLNEPSSEDVDQTKRRNIIQFQSLGQKLFLQKSLQKEDSQEVQDPKQRLKQVLQNKKFGILLVDDQIFNLIAFKTLLQDLISDLVIIEAYNGQQAINKLLQNQKNLNIKYVFMDLYMPILNGWQAAQNIRTMINNREIDDVKLVALSGFDDEVEQEKCEKLGFDAFIPKPIKLEVIAEVFFQLENEH
ncbi:unnamed protein product (macronuclear) [Paramecium tetraurelia]|uniref:Uncharacterized protein n=1 Tax=Paramecium tetraurelia TaxID=5888 RepID=A0DXY0_PARTE|nr:uncharacterized protein GSPATT00021521001 [Paramecium tetraurelia]CAK87897.1 unnamed protein product [Paramecium tetraurelia]|eukprot:XP_001455294.1 hypothetical protein (macronuclear) [Paramecium tetraurelia strain d4-2]